MYIAWEIGLALLSCHQHASMSVLSKFNLYTYDVYHFQICLDRGDGPAWGV